MIIKVIFFIFFLLYPFALFFLPNFRDELLLAMAILWAIKSHFDNSELKIFYALASIFFVICIFIKSYSLPYFYPTIVNLAFFLLFLYSLKSEPFITKIARLKDGNLSKNIENYTKNLTLIWIAFFALNGMVSALLAILENKIYWSFYCGFFSYILIGVLFALEFIFRKFYIKRVENE